MSEDYGIGKSKRAEVALGDGKERLEDAIESISDAFVLYDADGKLVLCNQKQRDFFPHLAEIYRPGVSQEEVMRHHAAALLEKDPAFDIEGYLDERLKLINTPRPDHEGRLIDGRWVAIRESALTGGGMVSIRTDITERKQAEAALIQAKEAAEAAEELFSKAFHSSPAIFTISSPKDARHIDVNDAWSSAMGYSREEARQKTGRELGIWVNLEDRLEFVEQIENQGFIRNFETVFRTKYGVEKDMLLSGEIISYRGEDCLLLVGQDITARKEIDRMKSEFVSTVSHELRTPLTSIKGSLGLLVDGVLGTLPEKAKGMVDIAYKNTERLITLVNDILDMEKLDSGSMEFDFQPLDLSDLVREAVETYRGFAEVHGVKFVLVGLAPGVKVWGDYNRLTQVVANLLSNAAKFSPEGGEVEISVASQDGVVNVSVSDHGPGIAEEFRELIFGRFTQVDASDSRQKGGSGLGLNITKSIVEKHDGAIGFDTEVGAGSTFFFTLPASE